MNDSPKKLKTINDFDDPLAYDAYIMTLGFKELVPSINEGETFQLCYDYLGDIASEVLEYSPITYLDLIDRIQQISSGSKMVH